MSESYHVNRARHEAPGIRRDFLPFHRPTIDETDVEAVASAIRSGWLTLGRTCAEFEEAFRRKVGAEAAISVSSGTAALEVSLAALGVGGGDEVITSPFTFCATALAIEHVGATPVFADIQPPTLQIDPQSIEAALTSRTRAILPVHYGGHPCDLPAILRLARANGVFVVEDAAHALGAAIDGREVGSFGDPTCFSFYATKNITTGEGGMVTTGGDRVVDRIKRLRLHGISRDAWRRYEQGGSWFYEVLDSGFKANLTDFQAALGLSQLAKEPRMRAARESIAQRYTRAFAATPDLLQSPSVMAGVRSAWHLYPLRLRLEAMSIGRNEFIVELERWNIGVSVHFIPLHLQPYFRERYGLRQGAFPNAEDAFRRVVSLPIYPTMTDDDVEYVIEAVLTTAKAHAC